MDPTLLALASSGASTLVAAMATDAWSAIKGGMARVLGGGDKHGEESALAKLEASHQEAVQSMRAGDDDATIELTQEWQGRLRRLLAARPDLADSLQEVLDTIDPSIPSALTTKAGDISIKAEARGHGRVYQQGQGTQLNI